MRLADEWKADEEIRLSPENPKKKKAVNKIRQSGFGKQNTGRNTKKLILPNTKNNKN
jgi:hypothetical protein